MGKYLKYNFLPTVVLPLSSFFVAVSSTMCIIYFVYDDNKGIYMYKYQSIPSIYQ